MSKPSYIVYWRHLPALQLARQQLKDNEEVVQAIEMAWKDMERNPSSALRLIWGSSRLGYEPLI